MKKISKIVMTMLLLLLAANLYAAQNDDPKCKTTTLLPGCRLLYLQL